MPRGKQMAVKVEMEGSSANTDLLAILWKSLGREVFRTDVLYCRKGLALRKTRKRRKLRLTMTVVAAFQTHWRGISPELSIVGPLVLSSKASHIKEML